MSPQAKETLKVLVDCRMADWSGVGRYTRGLVRGLSAVEGMSLVLVTTPEAWPVLSAEAGVTLVRAKYRPFSLLGMLELSRVIAEQQPDVVHCLHFPTPTRLKAPLVVTMHDLTPLIVPEVMPSALKRGVYRYLNRRAVRLAARIVAPSESTMRDVERFFPEARGRMTAIAEAADDFASGDSAPVEAGARSPYILAMGNTKAHKDLPVLFAAFGEIAPTHPELQVLLVGPEPQGYLAQSLPAGLCDRVSFTGAVDDDRLRALYSGASVFAFPSRYEGFGLPPLEAMSLGAPVVAAEASSVPEVVGDAALLFPPGDAPALAAALTRLLDDKSLRDELLGRGFARAAGFSWAQTARQTADVYRAAASRRD